MGVPSPRPGKCLTFFSFPPATLRPCPHYRSIYSCPHYRFDAFSTVHTKTFESDRIARCDVSWTLCACYKHTHLRWFRSSFWFGMFWTVHTNTTCMRFRFYPLSRAFSNRRVFDVNVRCISVNRRRKRIEMYAFSKENALVWMGLYAHFSRLK